jgi:archaellum component FlaC
MPIIVNLRDEINHAINLFKENRELSAERKQDIATIKHFFSTNDPIEVRNNLLNFINNLSTGFISIWPFLEVNQFKKVLKAVLEQPKYEEKQFLKTVSAEIQSGSSIFRRFEILENLVQSQQSKIGALQHDVEDGQNKIGVLQKKVSEGQSELGSLREKVNVLNQEIESLRSENTTLTKSLFHLRKENRELQNLNATITQQYGDLKQEYEVLMQENRALKQQLQSFTHSDSPKQELKKEYPPSKFSIPNSIPKNYSFINSISKQSVEPKITTTLNQPSAQQNERKLFTDRTPLKVF